MAEAQYKGGFSSGILNTI